MFKFPATCLYMMYDDHYHSILTLRHGMGLTTVLSVVSVCLLLFCGGRLLYEQYYGKQNCEMTYMYLYPQYQVGGRTKHASE